MSSASVVLGMWQALSDRNWEAIKPFLSEDCIYLDMPVGPPAAARGPEDIVKRLKIGLEPLRGYVNHPGLMLADGEDVMFEHSETWTWQTGETALLPFVTVHKVIDGRITLWKDYWDMSALTNFAPASWLDDFATADMSWMYDATGKV